MTTDRICRHGAELARSSEGTRAGTSVIDTTTATEWVDKLWASVRAVDEYSALDVVANALDAGLDAEAVLLDVIGAVQDKVGTEWAANRLSVADEHAATAINDRVIAALPVKRPATVQGRITVACVNNEWHALPARLLAETLRLRGWQVAYLGAQVPTSHLVSHLHRAGPAVVCLSSSLPTRLPAAHAAITACQATGTPVMVGGRAFGTDGRYARLLGADAWAPEARCAADTLAAGPLPAPRAAPRAAHQAVDDLPHLADQEYTLVTRSARHLVREVFQRLEQQLPAMAGYSEEQRERTAEDLAHIVDFLTTALYVDDADLFTDFLTWTAQILTSRGVPARSLLPGLDLLAEQLRDFPRTRRLITAGRTALTGRP
ncbi:cobalamin B12-binding domain-containing protein [Actinoplanes couchii]|uniref:Cobalamin-binding protein n=1 Tax=Actinoplanes couchii TaxID=403638 RepID=A0ABQ3XUA5_9ACTN|nr:cobalamin-dependent protein [Actinoplanes couchii]MDR6324517.1 methanogenic corrinoid protein MtbC1 [Actinoplanes couchii]GID62045.1 cobalamin-binding protein [Actinoplanes couchii]